MTTTDTYTASPIKRRRRTNAEMDAIRHALLVSIRKHLASLESHVIPCRQDDWQELAGVDGEESRSV